MALIGKMRFSSEYHFKSQLNLIQPHILHDFLVQLDNNTITCIKVITVHFLYFPVYFI